MQFFVQLYSSWQDFNCQSALHGPCAVAELVVLTNCSLLQLLRCIAIILLNGMSYGLQLLLTLAQYYMHARVLLAKMWNICICSHHLLLNLMALNLASTFHIHHLTMLMASICRRGADLLQESIWCCVHSANDPRPPFMMQLLPSAPIKLQLLTAWKISFELVCFTLPFVWRYSEFCHTLCCLVCVSLISWTYLSDMCLST